MENRDNLIDFVKNRLYFYPDKKSFRIVTIFQLLEVLVTSVAVIDSETDCKNKPEISVLFLDRM